MSNATAPAVASTPAPLVSLTEDEALFRDTVRQFADQSVRPYVKEMDEKGVFEPALVKQFFELGLMGIEVPEQYGGGGGTFFEAILAVEEFSRVDPSAGVVVDVQNTLVNNALLRWGTDEQKQQLPASHVRDTVGAYALSEASSGSDAFALQTRAERRATSTFSTAGSCGLPTPRKRACSSSLPPSIPTRATRASRPSSSKRHSPASPSARKKTSSASAPPPPASSSWKTAACPRRTCWARSARATRWPSRR